MSALIVHVTNSDIHVNCAVNVFISHVTLVSVNVILSACLMIVFVDASVVILGRVYNLEHC